MIMLEYPIELAEFSQELSWLTVPLLECDTCHCHCHVTDKLKKTEQQPEIKQTESQSLLINTGYHGPCYGYVLHYIYQFKQADVSQQVICGEERGLWREFEAEWVTPCQTVGVWAWVIPSQTDHGRAREKEETVVSVQCCQSKPTVSMLHNLRAEETNLTSWNDKTPNQLAQ